MPAGKSMAGKSSVMDEPFLDLRLQPSFSREGVAIASQIGAAQ
jgi:hypothetical protein